MCSYSSEKDVNCLLTLLLSASSFIPRLLWRVYPSCNGLVSSTSTWKGTLKKGTLKFWLSAHNHLDELKYPERGSGGWWIKREEELADILASILDQLLLSLGCGLDISVLDVVTLTAPVPGEDHNDLQDQYQGDAHREGCHWPSKQPGTVSSDHLGQFPI